MTWDRVSELSSKEFPDRKYLKPVTTPLTRLVTTFICIKHLDHQSFTRRLDTVIKQGLDLIQHIGVTVLGILELALDLLERFMQKFTALP